MQKEIRRTALCASCVHVSVRSAKSPERRPFQFLVSPLSSGPLLSPPLPSALFPSFPFPIIKFPFVFLLHIIFQPPPFARDVRVHSGLKAE